MSSHVLAVSECLIGDRHNAEIKTVSELVSASKIFVEDGNHGENRPRQDEFCEQGNGIPFLRPPDLKEGRVDFRNCDFINAQGFARVRKGIGKPGDVILTHRATVGRIAITGSDAPTVFVTNPGTTIWRSLDKDLLDQRYLYFYMSSRIFQDRLFSEVGHTSTFDYVSLTQQRTLPVVIPEIRLQRQIAHILGTLDDKIELNRKTNETLEAMAKALFKSWFVDFDPVRAKAEGRPTGLPAEISDLFPDSFEDSELGEIPSGWAVTTVGEVTDLVTKGTTPTSIGGAFSSEGIPFYKVESISDEGHIIPGKCAFIDDKSDALLARSRIEEGDILFSIAGTIGRVAQMTRFDIPANTNQALAIARPSNRRISSTLLFYFLRERGRIDLALSRTVQSVQANFSLSELKSIPLALPQQSSRIALEDIFDSLRKKISSNQRNSFSISALRDTLLPKLISGEIRIPDAEQMLEEVGV